VEAAARLEAAAQVEAAARVEAAAISGARSGSRLAVYPAIRRALLGPSV
jgi:hypothetical protein